MAIANLAWEIAQLPLYTLWQESSWSTIAWAVLHCTAGDIAIAGATMLAAPLLVGCSDWPAGAPWRTVIAATIIGAAYTIYSEWLNVEIRGNWAYAAAMPRLPVAGTGLTPFLQWLLLPPLCFAAAAAHLRSSFHAFSALNLTKEVTMRSIRLLTIATAFVLLASAMSPAAWAQAAAPDPHHPADPAKATAPTAEAMPAPPAAGVVPGQAPSAAQPGRMGQGNSMGMMGPGMGMMPQMMQGMGMGMGMMGGPDRTGGKMMETDPVAGALAAINHRMHRDMMVDTKRGPDNTFATAMIAHHLGAIDMAKVELGFGKDPEMKKLALEIIAAQEKEVAFLRQWLALQPQ